MAFATWAALWARGDALVVRWLASPTLRKLHTGSRLAREGPTSEASGRDPRAAFGPSRVRVSANAISAAPCCGPNPMTRYLRAGGGVKGAIFRNGRILLLHRRVDLELVPGLWDLPGGGVESGEGLEDALVREVREETGFDVSVGPPIFAWVHSTRTTKGRKLTSIIVCYECHTLAKGPPRLDPEEHTESAWVARDELSRYSLPPKWSKAIKRAFELKRRA